MLRGWDPSPWRTFEWMPVGDDSGLFTFRHGQGAERAVTLHYGNGPLKLSIGEREFAFASSVMTAAGSVYARRQNQTSPR
jgi:hypothetical protein